MRHLCSANNGQWRRCDRSAVWGGHCRVWRSDCRFLCSGLFNFLLSRIHLKFDVDFETIPLSKRPHCCILSTQKDLARCLCDHVNNCTGLLGVLPVEDGDASVAARHGPATGVARGGDCFYRISKGSCVWYWFELSLGFVNSIQSISNHQSTVYITCAPFTLQLSISGDSIATYHLACHHSNRITKQRCTQAIATRARHSCCLNLKNYPTKN